MHEKLVTEKGSEAGEDAATKARLGLHRMPKLIYIPFVWDDREKSIWAEMSHKGTVCPSREEGPGICQLTRRASDRHFLLSARSGSIARKDIVMPIDLTYQSDEKVE